VSKAFTKEDDVSDDVVVERARGAAEYTVISVRY